MSDDAEIRPAAMDPSHDDGMDDHPDSGESDENGAPTRELAWTKYPSPLVESDAHSYIEVRRQVLRRVRYATNTLALQEDRIPPEGPFDAALTNGLLAIIADELPGEEYRPRRGMRSARELLRIVEAKAATTANLLVIEVAVLREALNLTQPVRHGRADDEFAVVEADHVAALIALDAHPALSFLDIARGHSVDACCVLAFQDLAERELPAHPKDRLLTPDPDTCDMCGRLTFLPLGWDDFGGTDAAGMCVACGHERTREEAYESAVDAAMSRHMNSDD